GSCGRRHMVYIGGCSHGRSARHGMNDAGQASLEGDVRALCERGDYDGAATLALKGMGGEIYQFLAAVHRDPVMADDCFSSFGEGLWRGLASFTWSSTLRTWAY